MEYWNIERGNIRVVIKSFLLRTHYSIIPSFQYSMLLLLGSGLWQMS